MKPPGLMPEKCSTSCAVFAPAGGGVGSIFEGAMAVASLRAPTSRDRCGRARFHSEVTRAGHLANFDHEAVF
jgi:hypothetical protein